MRQLLLLCMFMAAHTSISVNGQADGQFEVFATGNDNCNTSLGSPTLTTFTPARSCTPLTKLPNLNTQFYAIFNCPSDGTHVLVQYYSDVNCYNYLYTSYHEAVIEPDSIGVGMCVEGVRTFCPNPTYIDVGPDDMYPPQPSYQFSLCGAQDCSSECIQYNANPNQCIQLYSPDKSPQSFRVGKSTQANAYHNGTVTYGELYLYSDSACVTAFTSASGSGGNPYSQASGECVNGLIIVVGSASYVQVNFVVALFSIIIALIAQY